jgi:transposase IS116/IS110/IS902 family protein
MTHPGVGPITGVAYVLVIGTPERFPCGKQIGSYTGLIPCEDSSAGKQRLGHISRVEGRMTAIAVDLKTKDLAPRMGILHGTAFMRFRGRAARLEVNPMGESPIDRAIQWLS